MFCWKAGLGFTTGLGAKDLDVALGDEGDEPNAGAGAPNETFGVGAANADGAGAPVLNPAEEETPGFADVATAAPNENPEDVLTSADGATEGVAEVAFGAVLGTGVTFAAGVALVDEAACGRAFGCTIAPLGRPCLAIGSSNMLYAESWP